MRKRLYDAPFYRLVHAEADGLPGLIIDRFGDVAVMQPNAAWADTMADQIADALVEVAGVSTVVLHPAKSNTVAGINATPAKSFLIFMIKPLNKPIFQGFNISR